MHFMSMDTLDIQKFMYVVWNDDRWGAHRALSKNEQWDTIKIMKLTYISIEYFGRCSSFFLLLLNSSGLI